MEVFKSPEVFVKCSVYGLAKKMNKLVEFCLKKFNLKRFPSLKDEKFKQRGRAGCLAKNRITKESHVSSAVNCIDTRGFNRSHFV